MVEHHAQLMDHTYKWQRHFYDATRKHYLFGRDRMLRDLRLEPRGSVLEIGCGTGRNLALVRRHWSDAKLFGLDISVEMLKSARANLGLQATLALGDAATFDSRHLFGRERFDRIVLSYCLSMIPAWEETVTHACGMLRPGGSLHIVDFGDMSGIPLPLRRPLLVWLEKFHVTPRLALVGHAKMVSAGFGVTGEARNGPCGYYQQIVLRRPA